MVYGILNGATKEFRYVSAGHPGPAHLPFGGDPVILDGDGFPIGLADSTFDERSIHLQPGDRLFLYTDGVTEALDSAGNQFGDSRLLEVIGRERSKPLEASITTLIEEITRWNGSEKLHDDISILAVEVSIESRSNQKQLGKNV
jgi:sigma-B regulation protein RsbU (phosphoserine phosphatase)